MIANQTKIKFNTSGDSFFANETLELFPNRFNILYGRNGSGKSSISQAIANYVANTTRESSNIEFIEPLSEEDKKHIFVFNENFIEKNIKVNQDGLNQIIMLGEQVELDSSIKECEERLHKITEENAILQKSIDINVKDSIVNKINIIRDELIHNLMADGNWADRARKIDNRYRRTFYENNIFDIIKVGRGTKSLLDLQNDIEKGIEQLSQTRGKVKILWNCPSFTEAINIEDLTNILNKKIENPVLTDRDKTIIKIVEHYGHFYSKTEEVFSNESVGVCPLCLRPIDSDSKKNAIQMVKKILNKEAEEYIHLLKTTMEQLNEIPLSVFSNIDNELFKTDIKNAQAAFYMYNAQIIEIKNLIQERLDNIYKTVDINIDAEKYNKILNDLRNAFGRIDERIKEYNNIIDTQEAFKNEISLKNKQLAFVEFESSFNEFITLKEKVEHNKQLLLHNKNTETQERIQLKKLQEQKQRVNIALKFINQALSYIFFDKNRLQLTEDEGCYKLLSRKKEVKPTKISIGERNIIALCYFFANMFMGKEEKDKYKDASIIVIDDPVSSFDFENKVGVVSLLKWMSEKFLKGNINTKILIMTHDIQTVFNLQKVRKELDNDKEGHLELVDKSISPQNGLHNEYKDIMVSVYNYAKDKIAKKSSVIGNQMRKLMEAYSSFIYARDFMSISHDDEVLKAIPENKRLYYKNLMTRLVLNGESHEQEAANAMDLTGFKFTMDEKVIVAKSIIMFLYYINPKHISSYLPDGAIEVINQWQSEGFDILEDT